MLVNTRTTTTSCMTLLLLLCSLPAITQNQLRILPHYGKQSLLTSLSMTSGDPTFKNSTFTFTNVFGASLQYETNSGWQFYGGISTTKVEIGYRYNDTRNRDKLLSYRSVNFPIGIQKNISTHKAFKTKLRLAGGTDDREDSSSARYLLLFRSRVVAGFSVDLWEDLPATDHNDFGKSAFAGITLQFFDRKRDHLSLTILYNHGFRTRVFFPVRYILNAQEYVGEISSRGSYISIQVGYPIIVFSRVDK